MDLETKIRLAQERRVLTHLIRVAKCHGWNLHSVVDGGARHYTTSEKAALDVVFSVDESTISFEYPGHHKRCVAFVVLGNSGPEVIADHSVHPGWDDVMAESSRYCDALEQFNDAQMVLDEMDAEVA